MIDVEATAVPLVEPDHFEGAVVVLWPDPASVDAPE
jgi:hypothetical protein